MRPPRADGPEWDRFVNDFSIRAGELADAFKVFYDRNPGGKEGREAWRDWMNYLDMAAQRLPERKAELEAAEKRALADPADAGRLRELARACRPKKGR